MSRIWLSRKRSHYHLVTLAVIRHMDSSTTMKYYYFFFLPVPNYLLVCYNAIWSVLFAHWFVIGVRLIILSACTSSVVCICKQKAACTSDHLGPYSAVHKTSLVPLFYLAKRTSFYPYPQLVVVFLPVRLHFRPPSDRIRKGRM